MLRVTINKPATDAWFKDGDELVKGLQIKLGDNGEIAMRPVKVAHGTDIVALNPMTRGGAEVFFSGSRTADVANALSNPHFNPFFKLRMIKGWLRPEPLEAEATYASRAEPSRTSPWIRVWSGNLYRSMAPAILGGANIAFPAVDWDKAILGAHDLMRKHETTRPNGRPDEETAQAQALLLRFDEIARVVLPKYRKAVELHDLLAQKLSDETSSPIPAAKAVKPTEKATKAAVRFKKTAPSKGKIERQKTAQPALALVNGFDDEPTPDYADEDEWHE